MDNEVTNDRSVLRELRRTRQLRRLGDTEWFDVAYRVYLFALLGLTAVVLASDAVGGLIGDDVTTDDLLRRGPATLGVVVAVAAGLGMRSGANGGPIAVEVADIRHVLLAPIEQRWALLRPIAQRMRSAMFASGLSLAVLGQLVAREVDGSRAAWAAAGALFGALVGAVFVSAAVISHAVRLPRWLASVLGASLLVWQAAAAWATWQDAVSRAARIGPMNLLGSVALWGIRQRGIDIVAIAVVVIIGTIALFLGNGLRIEPLARRGQLVSQLRFAATVQDLRTVVMLRRQLRAETLRNTPWLQRSTTPVRRRGDHSRPISIRRLVWRRGVRSLRRLPASRLARIVSLALLGGLCASLTVTSTLLFLIGVLAALFLLGIESIEALSQEIDHPDITDSLPIDRGELYVHHLAAPALLLAVAGLIGAVAATALAPHQAAAAFAIAVPMVWAGAVGPVVAAILDAPVPIAVADTTLMGAPRDQDGSLVPPEFAGFSNAFSTFMPLILSAAGLVPLIAMRAAPSAGSAVRAAVGVALLIALVAFWIRRRDRWGVKIRAFFEAGRAQQAATS